MRSDPRTGLIICYALAAAAGLWLLANILAADALFGLLGSNVHPITFLAIFVGLTALVVGQLIFRRYARVKADLLGGRRVIARWRADRDSLHAVGLVSEAAEQADKRGALLLIFFFVAIIFGAFALFDSKVAPFMLSVAGVLIVIVAIAYVIGNRVRHKQLEFRNGDIIIGPDGLIVNDTLHVWGGFMSSLDAVELAAGPPDILVITYSTTTRTGRQVTNVLLPVPPAQRELAGGTARQLVAAHHLGHRGRIKGSTSR
jgi:hypothetical protein